MTVRMAAPAGLSLRGLTPEVLLSNPVMQPPDSSCVILHSSSLLVLGNKSAIGEKVIDTTPMFWELLRFAKEHGPEVLHRELPRDGRLFEELIAGIYREMGAKIVELSPQSGDGGVDVWAIYELPGAGEVTIMDQAKLYGPNTDVEPGDIHRILSGHRGLKFSKAIISTTGNIPPVSRREAEEFGERVTLRDASVLSEVFSELLQGQTNNDSK